MGKTKKLHLLFCFIVILVAAPLSFYFSVKTGIFEVKKIEIKIADRQPHHAPWEKKVQKLTSSFLKKQIWEIDLGILKEDIQNLPWVEKFYISRQFPDQISIEIISKKIPALTITSNGQIIPISEDANLLPQIPASYAPNVPVLKGNSFIKSEDLRKKAIALLETLPESGKLSREAVTEISSDQRDSLLLSLMKSETQIHLGEENLPLKIARVTKVLDYLEMNQIKSRVIDADFSQKVLVRPRHRR